MHPYLPLFQQALLYIIGSATLATILVPFLTKILYKYKVTRRSEQRTGPKRDSITSYG
jgi:hypothetical protein